MNTSVYPKHRADIDGLRAIAVFAVIGFHAFPGRIASGFVGVDVFFVISGFLITTIILESLEKNTFSYIEFYSRRIKRIFPALILVLIATFLLGWVLLLPQEYTVLGKHIAGGAAFVSNFLLLGESGYFDVDAAEKPLLHLWSLGIEEQFYLVYPVLIYFIWKRRLHFFIAILLVAFISFSLNIYLAQVGSKAPNYYLPVTRFWELMLGALLAYGLLNHPNNKLIAKNKNILSILGVIALALSFFLIDTQKAFPGWWALLPTSATILIIAAGQNALLNRNVLSRRILVWFGLISYPLYLWHWPLLSFAHIVEGDIPVYSLRIVLILLSILLAWVTFKFFEQPIRLNRLDGKKILTILSIMSFVGVIGYTCYFFEGFGFRYPKEVETISEHVDFRSAEYVRNNECFLDDPLLANHQSTCFEKSRPLVALWGDSHAGLLYPGLKKLQSKANFGILDLTQSACPPIFGLKDLGYRKNCNEVNRTVFNHLVSESPDILILHSAWRHKDFPLSDMDFHQKLTATIRELKQHLPKTRIILIGPVPRWQGSPQKVVLSDWRTSHDNYKLHTILQKAIRLDDVDEMLEKISINNHVDFISAIDRLCNSEGCVSRVGEQPTDWIAVDYGHFSKAGSEYFISNIQDDLSL